MKIAYCAYRNWAADAFYSIQDYCTEFSDNIHIELFQRKSDPERVALDFDIIYFVGWSWKVASDIVSNVPCYCIHPSPMPRYLGGSPIQNQILAGEENSAVTLFRMTDEIDAGPILYQDSMSLDGTLDDILRRISHRTESIIARHIHIMQIGLEHTIECAQDKSQATYCKRRKPSESQITLEELTSHSSKYLYNKIRALYSKTEDYPPAYIKCADGNFLRITGAYVEEVEDGK